MNKERKIRQLRRVALARLRLKVEDQLGIPHEEETVRIAAEPPEAKAS
jgi:hypothetical protein